jgi:hypothetical protein
MPSVIEQATANQRRQDAQRRYGDSKNSDGSAHGDAPPKRAALDRGTHSGLLAHVAAAHRFQHDEKKIATCRSYAAGCDAVR